jgi:hypothetical protein
MRGLWRCKRVNMNRTVKAFNAPNSEYAARGCPTQATQGCGKWNVYIARDGRDPNRKIDTRCYYCNRRVKFQWKRQDDRGRPRPVNVLDRPDHMPRKALQEEMKARNGHINTPINTGFTPASTKRETASEMAARGKREGWLE